MFPFFYDPTMVLLIPALILGIYAQYKVRATYEKFSKVPSMKGKTGREIATLILHNNQITDVKVEKSQGFLSDHFDPKKGVIRLSPNIFDSSSVAAIGVAAHEAGHAIQHSERYFPLVARHAIFPVVSIGNWLAVPLVILGFILGQMQLIDLGILIFSIVVLFQVITLPVEFNASRRALLQLENGGYLIEGELGSAKKVLNAAALTYVAAAVAAILNLLRLLALRQSRN
ncbi:MAG: zinc metallopeptidase [Candidatus Eisenbacteria bacterium]|nr:zinc metallopeptidase [Candidatus Eisenbacteria bacterium]